MKGVSNMRTDILERKNDILKWIEENQSKAFMCQQLQCKPETLNNYLKKMNINYAGNQGGKGIKTDSKYMSAIDYIAKSSNIKSSVLKQKLIRDGIKKYKCEICGLSEWQGKPIPLELHHIDCNHFNNNLDNLQILCPNCHALQPGNSGSNINKYATVLEQADNILLDGVPERGVSSSLTSSTNYCVDCGKVISNRSQRCKSCASKFRQPNKGPSREILKNLIRNKPFTKIGEQFEVSDNAVRKWCKAYNLPYKSTEIKKISDEEWLKI